MGPWRQPFPCGGLSVPSKNRAFGYALSEAPPASHPEAVLVHSYLESDGESPKLGTQKRVTLHRQHKDQLA